jgi:hypothetical protein
MTNTVDWTRFYSPRAVAVVGATDDTRGVQVNQIIETTSAQLNKRHLQLGK